MYVGCTYLIQFNTEDNFSQTKIRIFWSSEGAKTDYQDWWRQEQVENVQEDINEKLVAGTELEFFII